MSDFGSTAHVPVTSFPMRGDLLRRQEEILARWQAQDLYPAILEDRRDAQPFIIHDGPPYASGQTHVGTDLNKILKEVVAKFHAMRDRCVPFAPGWDFHGLPIETKVMKALGGRGMPSIDALCLWNTRALGRPLKTIQANSQKRRLRSTARGTRDPMSARIPA